MAGSKWPQRSSGLKPPPGTPLDPAHPLTQGLVAWWGLNEGTQGTLVDASGNGNAGVLAGGLGAPTLLADEGGQALSFSGAGAYYDLGTRSALDCASGQLSLFVRCRPASATQNAGLVCKWQTASGTNNAYLLFLGQNVGNNRMGVSLQQANNTIVTVQPSDLSFAAGEPMNVVATADGATLRLYKNAQQSATTAAYNGTLAVQSSRHATLGRLRTDDTTFPYSGRLLLAAIWNRALTSDEVGQLSRAPLVLYAPPRRLWLMPRTQGPTLAAATLSASGTITRTPTHDEAGSSTPTGAITRTLTHQEAGSSTAAGTLARAPLALLAATLSAGTGTLARTIAATGDATLAASGDLGRTISGAYGAGLTATGDLARTLSIALQNGTLVAAGALQNVAQVARSAALALAGSFAGGALRRLYTMVLGASLDLAGALARTPRRQHAGALAPAGTLARTAARTQDAALAASGALARTITAQASALIAAVGGLVARRRPFAPALRAALSSLRRLAALAASARGTATTAEHRPAAQVADPRRTAFVAHRDE